MRFLAGERRQGGREHGDHGRDCAVPGVPEHQLGSAGDLLDGLREPSAAGGGPAGAVPGAVRVAGAADGGGVDGGGSGAGGAVGRRVARAGQAAVLLLRVRGRNAVLRAGGAAGKGTLRGGVAVLEDVGEELPHTPVLGRPALRQRPVRARGRRLRGRGSGSVQRSIPGVHAVADEGVADREAGGAGASDALPLLPRPGVEHDGSGAGSEECFAEAGRPPRQFGVLRLPPRPPPRILLASSFVLLLLLLLRRGR